MGDLPVEVGVTVKALQPVGPTEDRVMERRLDIVDAAPAVDDLVAELDGLPPGSRR